MTNIPNDVPLEEKRKVWGKCYEARSRGLSSPDYLGF